MLLKKRASDAVLLEQFGLYQTGELGNAVRTAQSYRYSLQALARWTGKSLPDITANDLRAFKREAPFKNTTKQQVVVAMHQFHKWGSIEGKWKRNGILDVPSPKVIPQLKGPLSLESARRALAIAQRPLEKRVIYFGLYVGCRISESAAMDETHVSGNWLVFLGKGSKKRRVPIHPDLETQLDEILSYKPASVQVLHSSFARLRKRLLLLDEEGLEATSHTLRRTCGSVMYDAGVGWEVIAKLLGHGSDVTAKYARIKDQTMVEGISRLDYYKGMPVQLGLF